MQTWLRALLERIDYRGEFPPVFSTLPTLMQQFARHLPFENIDVIQQKNPSIDAAFLKRKLIDNGRGGLCYELNPLFYHLLREFDFQVQMIRATINSSRNTMKHTHISTVLFHKEEPYLVEVGFGANQPFHPVPFTGEFVQAPSGEYCIRREEAADMYTFEKYENGVLDISYSFDLKPIGDKEINEAKDKVTTDPNSPFNQSLLVTLSTADGHMTLSESTFTVISQGEKQKETVDETRRKEVMETLFGIDTTYTSVCTDNQVNGGVEKN